MEFMCCFNVDVRKALPAHASFCLTKNTFMSFLWNKLEELSRLFDIPFH